MDDLLVWYEGSGTGTRRWFHQDERGSVIAVSDASGNLVGSTPNRYDEYGTPQGTLTGRFGYTGQMWLPEIGMYHYRARTYNPSLGRFMQTDPIGYAGGMNLYGYVLNDPVNLTDPMGTCPTGQVEITPTGSRIPRCVDVEDLNSGTGYTSGSGFSSGGQYVCTNCGEPGISIFDASGEEHIFITAPNYVLISAQFSFGGSTLPGGGTPTQRTPDYCGSDEQDLPEGVWAGACQQHDQCYGSGASKAGCDVGFFGDILADCTDAIFVPAICLAPVIGGYIIVDLFGGPAYRRATPRQGRRE